MDSWQDGRATLSPIHAPPSARAQFLEMTVLQKKEQTSRK